MELSGIWGWPGHSWHGWDISELNRWGINGKVSYCFPETLVMRLITRGNLDQQDSFDLVRILCRDARHSKLSSQNLPTSLSPFHSGGTVLGMRLFLCYLFLVHHLTLQLFLRFLAIMVTAVVSNYWVLIPAVLVMTIFLALRWYFLKTSREIKRLEAIGMIHY